MNKRKFKPKREPMRAAIAIYKQPGFDGAYFAHEPIRDHAGQGKRELVRRIRYDVVERLYRYKPPLIDLYQRDAAIQLQADDQLAKTPVLARVGTLGVAKNDFGLSDAILEATGRVRVCKSFLGLEWPLVECVVIANLNLSLTARAFCIDRLRVLPRLRAGLDLLAEAYERKIWLLTNSRS